MAFKLSIAEIAGDFPDFEAAVVVATDLQIAGNRPEGLEALIAAREAACRERFEGKQLADIAGINAWRRAYKQFGIKKTSYRSSIERLVKNVLAERRLPEINGFVDAYNAVSLAHLVPVGADDIDRIEPEAAFRYARDGDSFIPLGSTDGANDPPKRGEVVLASGSHVLCRRWNWFQDARSPISPQTTRAVVTLQANGEGNVRAAADDLMVLLSEYSNANCQVVVATAAKPVVEISLA